MYFCCVSLIYQLLIFWSTKLFFGTPNFFLVYQIFFLSTKVSSMWFWSVSWSTNCPVYFSFFLVDQRKICPVSDLFCSLSWIFCPVFFENVVLVSLLADQLSGQFLIFWKRLDKKFKRVNKKDLRLDKFIFGWPKKMRNRPDIGRPRDWPKPHGRD